MDTTPLTAVMDGTVLTTGESGYDEAREVWNARFDRKPDVIAQCRHAGDVAAAVRWAVENDLSVFVKGGGHSYAGKTVGDGGLLIDLSEMTRIKVTPEDRRASVEAGATWAMLDAATQHHALATTGPTVSSVGVAGSVLAGATGWLSRLHGHGLDNLVSVDLVTADGEELRVTPESHPDLWWGLRGAGQNLGVVTALELELHEVGPQVLAGQIIYTFENAEQMLEEFARFMETAPDEFQCLPFTFRVPPIDAFPEHLHGEPVLDFVVFHTDPEALDVVAPLRSLGTPVLDAVGPAEYVAVQQSFDANLPAGQRYYSSAQDLAALTPEAIKDFARFVRTSQGEFTASYFEPKGGASGRVDSASSAMGGRGAAYGFHVIAGWMSEDADESVIGWAHDFSHAMATHATGGVYLNLIGDDEGDRVASAFTDVDRVRSLKQTWDPHGVLSGNYALG